MSRDTCSFCRGMAQYRSYASNAESMHAGLLVADLPASYAILSIDQFYRGYTVVLAKTHATELFHLPQDEADQYLRDMQAIAKAIADAFAPRKMNYELLGNTVPHLHWHLIPRYGWDPNPTRPVWEYQHQPVLLDSDSYAELAREIRARLTPRA
ncbi:MAG TPA: HIT family protein [Terriglobales bacterium]|nr:HIT family protein [Terriglobales bacterium]